MSKIAILIDPGSADESSLLGSLRKASNTSLGELARRLHAHMPVLELTLFQNDHDEVATRLRGLMSEMVRQGASLRFIELEEEEDWNSLSDLDAHAEPAEHLENMLVAHDQGIEHLHELDDRRR